MHEDAWYTMPDWWVAGFTGALFLATVGLWIFTALLWLSTRKTLNLARDEFVATHRPKFITRNFQTLSEPFTNGDINVIFIAQNIGDSAGRITEVRSGSIVLSHASKLPGNLAFGFKDAFDVTLTSGERELFPANGVSEPTEGEWFEIFEGSKSLYCLGVLIYMDGANAKRETGFCRRYVNSEKRWEVVESEYEYSY